MVRVLDLIHPVQTRSRKGRVIMGDRLIDALAKQDDRVLPDTLKGLISQGRLKRAYGEAKVDTTIPGGWRPLRSSDVLLDMDGHLAVMARDLYEQIFKRTKYA